MFGILKVNTIMRTIRSNALFASLLLAGVALAQQGPPPKNAKPGERAPAFQPAAGASAPVAPSVRPEVGKPLIEAQTLLNEKKLAQAKEKLLAANSVPDKTPYENYVISRLTLSAAIAEDDAETVEKMLDTATQLSKDGGGGWLKPEEALALTEAVGIVQYRVKKYPQAALWMDRYLQAGGTDPQAKALRIQAFYLGANYPRAVALTDEEITQSKKDGKTPSASNLEILAQSYDKLKDNAGYVRALEMLVQYYPKKDYWQSLVNRLWLKTDLAARLQLDVFRLAFQTGTLQETNDYTEYMDFAQKAGYSAEALKVYDQGAAAGLLGTGANAAAHAKLRAKLVQESEQDRKTMNADVANAMKKPDGTSMVRVGMNLVGLGQFDKGLDLMEKGIAKGALKRPEDARLDLAIAYVMAGQMDKATQNFAAVSGKEGLDELGRYWTLAIRKP